MFRLFNGQAFNFLSKQGILFHILNIFSDI